VTLTAAAPPMMAPPTGNPVFDESGTSPKYRGLLGAWGPATWQNDPLGEKMILIIQSVDAGDNARGVVGRSSSDGWFPFAAQIAGNRLVLEAPVTRQVRIYTSRTETDNWAFEIRPDGSLLGSRNGNANSILLTRLQ
jgi:hypothetical protein